MVNPILTVLFDLFLIGSAIAIIAAMVQEYFDSRTPSIGGTGAATTVANVSRGTLTQTAQNRRRQLKRVA